MKAYLEVIKEILGKGRERGDRTGTGTISIFDAQFRHDMREGFPLLTTKKMHLRGIFEELMAFLRGEEQLESLIDKKVTIWDPWRVSEDVFTPRLLENWERVAWMWKNLPEASAQWEMLPEQQKTHEWLDDHGIPRTVPKLVVKKGSLNAPYGSGWRAFKTGGVAVDQLAYALDLLHHNPESRRILISAWNPGWMPDESISPQENIIAGKPCLTPCHWAFEFYTEEMSEIGRWEYMKLTNPTLHKTLSSRHGEYDKLDNCGEILDSHQVPTRYLSLKWHQRSTDTMIGLPYNIASYALLLLMVAEEVGMVPYMLLGDLSNVHIYKNHLDQMRKQLEREPKSLPTVSFKRKPDAIEGYQWDDVVIEGYAPHPTITGNIAV